MSQSSEIYRELERWKDKYFDLNETYDEHKKTHEDYIGLIQRFLVRISLAAEHVNEELDSELDSLRTAIRQASPENNDLETRLKRIDPLILDADERRASNADKVLGIMSELIEQLQQLDVSRKQKSSIRKLSKSLKDKVHHFEKYPEFLAAYAQVQGDCLQAVLDNTPKPEGFFQRLLGGGSQSTDTSSVDENALAEDASVDASELHIEDEILHEQSAEAMPGFSAIARHIRSTIQKLLGQLDFPDSVAEDLAEFSQRVEQDLNWYELAPLLSDLANLVISAVGKGQRDFESFLLALDERLSKVQSSLLESERSDKLWRTQSHELDRVMREQVSEMTRDIGSVSDIEELKQSITTHLDAITGAMDNFAQQGDQREQDKDAQFKAMQEKLKTLEEEAEHTRKRLKEERQNALTDVLTGLPNRESYNERLELELERWKRYRKPVALVVADVDHFKSINDEYGHLAGDKVLQILAKEIRHRIRATDFVARFGGEEFVLLLPETELDVAREVIDKTREMIGRLPFHFRDERVNVSMSFGIVGFENEVSTGELFERADRAMYQAKQNGRNRVEVWTS